MSTKWLRPNWALMAPEKEIDVIDTVDFEIENLHDFHKITKKAESLQEEYDGDYVVLQEMVKFDDGSINVILDMVEVKE